MTKGVKLVIIFIAILLLSSSVCLAAFSYKGNNIETNYSAGSKIRGTINLSFANEPADSIFRSNFDGTINLLDLLMANDFVEGVDYNCSFPNCEMSYNSIGSISSIILNKNEPLYVGFKIPSTKDLINVESLKFFIMSDAGASCERQILVDLLDKNESFITNDKSSGDICEEKYSGCFNYEADMQLADITTNLYCENISLRPAPAYKIGAVVKKGNSPAELTMTLFNSEWSQLAYCILPEQTQETESLSCIVNYSVKTKGDYFVCINSDSDAEYKIRSEEISPKCGTATGAEPYNIDFEIFAQPMKFDSVGTIGVNSTTFENLADYVDVYLEEKYQRNCSNSCIIPFKISGNSQTISFSNAVLKYKRNGLTSSLEGLQKLEKLSAKITSKPLNIDITKAGFVIPLNTPNKTKLQLYLNEKSILPSPISLDIIPSFGFEVSPKTILLGTKTDFQIVSPYTITSSNWDFGDGSSGSSSGKFISHRYRQFNPSGYVLSVTVKRSDNVTATNKFDLTIGSLSSAANNLLAEYKNRTDTVIRQINLYPLFVASALNEKIKLSDKNDSLNSISQAMANATNDEEYLTIINDALLINPPAAVVVVEEGTLPLSGGFENIDIGFIKQISESELSANLDEDVRLAIMDWFNKNYDGSATYSIFATLGDNGQMERILTRVRVTLTKKADADESANNAHLIINYPPEGIRFAGNYSDMQVGSGVYLPVSDSATIEFVILDDIKVYDLGIYISPTISELEAFRKVEFVEKPRFNWGRFIFWTIILLVIAFAVYIALQEWYKRKYESYLFKNPNDLYNVITFIFNSRKNGIDDSEIAKKLKTAGWKGEQITYAFKKIDGKRTGMWEIPIFRFFEKRKIEQEIEKRKKPQQTQQTEQVQQQTKPLLK
ncbi:MAG: hypothetical protein QXS38_00505 [Candidatus Pacearchaeota archaeon]